MAEQEAPAPTPAAQPKRGIKFEFVKPGSLSHFLLWREGSGGTYSLLLMFLQWGLPLHINVGGPDGWQSAFWEMAFLAFFGSAVTGWYASAQANAVQYAVRNEGAIDANQINRDYGWSVLPLITVGAIWGLTIIGLILNQFTAVFESETTWWIRDRLVISYVMAAYSLVVIGVCRADLKNNNTVLSQLVQLAGRLMRFEQTH